jgi:hypothetical protein
MKKVLAVLFAVTLLVTTITSSVNAISSGPGIASGTWIGSGEVVSVNLTGTSYPDWLQLAAYQGFKANFDQQVCHPFPGGQSGWMADIRVLSGSEWVPVPTTQGWEPDEEGTYMACADVSRWGGTYALFAYYVKPENTPAAPLRECDFSPWMTIINHPASDWPGDPYTGYTFEAVIYDNPVAPGTAVSYEIIESVNLPPEIQTSASGTSEVVGDYDYIQTVVFYPLSASLSEAWSATFRVTFPTCYSIVDYTGGPR